MTVAYSAKRKENSEASQLANPAENGTDKEPDNTEDSQNKRARLG